MLRGTVPGREAHAGVVEKHDLATPGQRVHQQGIPVVEIAAEVLKEHQRRHLGAGVPESAIRVVDAVGRLEHQVLGRGLGVAGGCRRWA
jgi:hypothetical protein